MRMFTEAEDGSGLVEGLARAWEEGDVYLVLSVAGLGVFLALCVLVCLAWMHYGAVITTVFDERSGPQFSEEKELRTPRYYMDPWKDAVFPLSPVTRRMDLTTKKQN